MIVQQDLKGFIEVVKRGNYLVLDTETTGLNEAAEICQIAIIDDTGAPLLDTLVKPTRSIPADATAIHKINDAMVVQAPSWRDVFPVAASLLFQREVIIYNAAYDCRLMHQSTAALGVDLPLDGMARFHCAMYAFAEVYGDWNYRYETWKWKPLATACYYYNLPVDNAHSALGDCLMTLAVCKKMAGV